MNKIFIDCGANLGQGYDRLNTKYDLSNYKIIMFDIIPNACAALKDCYPQATILNNGVWNKNEEREIKIEGADMGGVSAVGHESNILQELHNISESGKRFTWEKIQLKCIDFSEFLTSLKDEYLFVKFDIEGAEYEVIDRLIETDTLKYINAINIEWHPQLRKDSVKEISYYDQAFLQNNIEIL